MNGNSMEKKKCPLRPKECQSDDDIKFAIKTEKAYQEIKKGKCKTLTEEEFLKELARW